MSIVWEDDDPAVWSEHLKALSDRLKALKNDKLSELDRWFWTDLPDVIQSRSPHYITAEELVKIVDWKLTQGRWRPKLLDYAKAQSNDKVKEASSEAFAALCQQPGDSIDSIDAALHPLTRMKGIGPATASAVLAAFSSDVPFMSDAALQAVQKKKEYTLKKYKNLVDAIRQKAASLSTKERAFTCKDVERALWSDAASRMKPKKEAGSKRKRDAT